MKPITAPLQGIRIPDVERMTGMRRSTIYRKVARREFPSPYRISDRCSVWMVHEVEEFLAGLQRGTLRQIAVAKSSSSPPVAPTA